MARFVRWLDGDVLESLRADALFEQQLAADIVKGRVFPAIRNNRVDFYYRGGRLFSYTSAGFVTHIKYASVITGTRSYVREGELPDLEPVESFAGVYDRIKENCALYSGQEAIGVSELLRTFGRFVSGKEQSVIPLDIEISLVAADAEPFEPDISAQKMGRIDILFYNLETKQLRFCEAKHFSNQDIWSSKPGSHPVLRQLDRYRGQIDKHRRDILAQYRNYVGTINRLLGTTIPEPDSIDTSIPLFLLIFGFDRDQQKGRLKKLLTEDGGLNARHCYSIGNIKNINLNNMWKCTTRKKGQPREK